MRWQAFPAPGLHIFAESRPDSYHCACRSTHAMRRLRWWPVATGRLPERSPAPRGMRPGTRNSDEVTSVWNCADWREYGPPVGLCSGRRGAPPEGSKFTSYWDDRRLSPSLVPSIANGALSRYRFGTPAPSHEQKGDRKGKSSFLYLNTGTTI